MRVAASSTEGPRAAARGHLGVAAFAAALALVVVPSAAQDSAVGANRARWRATGLMSYEYGYRKFCECHPESPPETVVTVRDGAVTGVRHRPVNYTEEVPAEDDNLEFYWTVDGLFDLLESAAKRGAQVRASYDPTLGYPTELYIDYDASFIGDELDLKLTQVRALDR
jgi:Family of unknown function (DUF6174)